MKAKPSTRYGGVNTRKPVRTSLFRHPERIVLLSFLSVILIGALLLMLPQATVRGSIAFVDALFTATSATCVTGLVVLDTGKDFTVLGQAVILFLIQIGGLGIMTFSTFFIYLIGGRLSVTQRDIVEGTLSQHPLADFRRLLISVFVATIIIELIGSALLTLRFMQEHPLPHSIYLGLFHSISAFCNAGFALFSDSLESYRGDVVVNAVVAGLIVLGGLGFVVIIDVFRNRRSILRNDFLKLHLHTRVVLFITLSLILAGFVIFYILEYNNTLSHHSFLDRTLVSFFQSITTRTAGFNTVDIGALSNATLFILIILMFIGASPASCGGGIKTSTFAILMASVFSRFRMREEVNVFHRRIPESIVSRAITVLFFSALVVVLFTTLLLVAEIPEVSHSESRGLFLEYLFEVVSAFGTVGLSTGVTSSLSTLSRILITLLMFIGRLGPLTIALAMRGRETRRHFKYVQENLLVG